MILKRLYYEHQRRFNSQLATTPVRSQKRHSANITKQKTRPAQLEMVHRAPLNLTRTRNINFGLSFHFFAVFIRLKIVRNEGFHWNAMAMRGEASYHDFAFKCICPPRRETEVIIPCSQWQIIASRVKYVPLTMFLTPPAIFSYH